MVAIMTAEATWFDHTTTIPHDGWLKPQVEGDLRASHPAHCPAMEPPFQSAKQKIRNHFSSLAQYFALYSLAIYIFSNHLINIA